MKRPTPEELERWERGYAEFDRRMDEDSAFAAAFWQEIYDNPPVQFSLFYVRERKPYQPAEGEVNIPLHFNLKLDDKTE